MKSRRRGGSDPPRVPRPAKRPCRRDGFSAGSRCVSLELRDDVLASAEYGQRHVLRVLKGPTNGQ